MSADIELPKSKQLTLNTLLTSAGVLLLIYLGRATYESNQLHSTQLAILNTKMDAVQIAMMPRQEIEIRLTEIQTQQALIWARIHDIEAVTVRTK